MSAKRKIVVSKSCRAALNGIREQLRKCSYIYRPVFHELFVPRTDFSDRSASDIWHSFKDAYQDLFTDEWEMWHGPCDASFFGRFYGCGDGFSEFEKLAARAYFVVREIDETLPEHGYHDCPDCWMEFLHNVAFDFATPLLDSLWTIWEKGTEEDSPIRVDIQEGVGDPCPLHPFHYELVHDVFVSSMAAIDLILNEEAPFMMGIAAVESPLGPLIGFEDEFEEDTEGEETVESGPPVTGRVRNFSFDGLWHLEFNTGEGIEKATFDKTKGFSIYDVLLRQRDEKPLSAGELLVKAGQIEGFEEWSSADYVYGGRGKRDLRTRMAEVEKEIDDTVNPERLQELKEQLDTLKGHWTSGVGHFGRSKKLDDPEERRINQVKSQLYRARQKIRGQMPKFGEYLRATVKVVGGEFIYRPI